MAQASAVIGGMIIHVVGSRVLSYKQYSQFVLAFASLCITEGGAVASEAAVLGVPIIYVNTQKMGYINMLEEYGLLRQGKDTKHTLQLSLEWLNDEHSLAKCHEARKKLLNDKIDVTNFIVETIER